MIAGHPNYLSEQLVVEAGFREISCELMQPKELSLSKEHCFISTYACSRLYPFGSQLEANYDLVHEASLARVQKLIIILPLFPKTKPYKKVVQEQEHICKAVTESGLDYLILKVNYLFSDFDPLLRDAEKGKLKIFGWGQYQVNPIHEKDLAQLILDQLDTGSKIMEIGGPEILTQMEIATMALKAQGKYPKIKHHPQWFKKWQAALYQILQSEDNYWRWHQSPMQLRQDVLGERHGLHRLQAYFRCEAQSINPKTIN